MSGRLVVLLAAFILTACSPESNFSASPEVVEECACVFRLSRVEKPLPENELMEISRLAERRVASSPSFASGQDVSLVAAQRRLLSAEEVPAPKSRQAKLQEGIDELIRQLRSDDPTVRDRSYNEIIKQWKKWTQRDLERLARIQRSRDPDLTLRGRKLLERIEVIRKVGETLAEQVQGIEAVIDPAGNDGCLDVLRKAGELWTTGKLKDSDLHVLVRLAKSEQWNLRVSDLLVATHAIRPFAPLISPLLGHKSSSVRAMAVYELGQIGGRDFEEMILPLVEDKKAKVRVAAVWALVEMSGQDHLSVILPLLEDKDERVRYIAASKIGVLRMRRYARRMLPLLKDPKPLVRREAVTALRKMGDHEIVDSILPLLKDDSVGVRAAAADAVRTLGTLEHAKKVLPLLTDEHVGVRICAAGALVRLLGRGLDARQRALWIQKLGPLSAGSDWKERIPASIVLVAVGGGDARLQRKLLREVLSGERRSYAHYLPHVLLDALSQAYERETYSKLYSELDLKGTIETARDLKLVLTGVGLHLREVELNLHAPINRGKYLSAFYVLDWAFPNMCTMILPEGNTLRVMTLDQAVSHWRERLIQE